MIEKYYGIYVQSDREALIAFMKQGGWTFPYTVLMPCGQSVVWQTQDDIPDHSVPCPCGRDGHWIIKFKRVPRS